jgi:ParB/RepB/Spo0J family partition protein
MSLASLTSLAPPLAKTSREPLAIVEISLGAISPNPLQARKQFDDKRLDEMAASIKANGVQQPVAVTEIEPGKYELIFGERRWRASQRAGLETIPATIKQGVSDNDKLTCALLENLDREDMTPYDEAVGVAMLVERTSVQEAATLLNKPKPWISKRVAIAGAQDFVTEFSGSGAVGDTEALYELSKLAADDPAQAKRFIEDFEPGGHLRAQLKEARRPAADDSAETDEDSDEDSNSRTSGERVEAVSVPRLTRPGGDDGDDDGEEADVPPAKPSPDGSPIEVKAVLRKAGQLYLATPDGNLRVNFSAAAQKQLLKLLDA